MKRVALILTLAALLFPACGRLFVGKFTPDFTVKVTNVKYAGVRSSSYGIKPFPDPEGWKRAIQTMQGYFEGSTPCAIWIVGRMKGKTSCLLEFPAGEKAADNIVFLDFDKHEPYLEFFDHNGIKVFLQVEPADADMGTLMDLVLGRYGYHPCVIGFGVDVEWLREADHRGWGAKVTDDSARVWESRVKSHGAGYRLFLKHWDRGWMPPHYRGDLIFVNDSQEYGDDFRKMTDEFTREWSDYFKPNTVFFQIGYRSDKPIWGGMQTPPRDIGRVFARRISQECGVFWVDFTMREVLPTAENQKSGTVQ
jgi:hypothetical protein